MYNLYKEYLEYFDLLDNQILLRSRDRKLEEANKKYENLINETKERYYDGHIGYTIEKEYRGYHYSKDACLLLFDKAKEKGFKQLMITCSPDNIASRKIIESLPFKYLETKEVPACLKKDFDQGDYIKRIYCLDLEEL